VVFITDNGAGPITTTFSQPAKNSLCDGNWHTIRGTTILSLDIFTQKVLTAIIPSCCDVSLLKSLNGNNTISLCAQKAEN
jgi:hypothetical protein